MLKENSASIWDDEVQRYIEKPARFCDWPFGLSFMPRKGDLILDAGCGAGTYMGMFREVSEHLYGIDISLPMVRTASRFGRCVVADISKLPFESSSFDYVINVGVISHCADPLQAISELARVCRPDGTVIIVVVNRYSFLTVLRKTASRMKLYRFGKSKHFSRSEMITNGVKCGLDLNDCRIWSRKPHYVTLVGQVAATACYYFDRIFRIFLPKHWGECLVAKFDRN